MMNRIAADKSHRVIIASECISVKHLIIENRQMGCYLSHSGGEFALKSKGNHLLRLITVLKSLKCDNRRCSTVVMILSTINKHNHMICTNRYLKLLALPRN